MCLAIYKPETILIDKDRLENGFCSNSHGAGFAYADGRKVVISKGFFTFDAFWPAFEQHQQRACLIHFRLATHGKMNAFNCHPWPMDGNAVVHNGILPIESTDEKSDTGHFVDLVLSPAVKAMGLDSPALKYLVEQAITEGNKIAVLTPQGSATIFNEEAGHWKDGSWFSNHSYSRSFEPWWTAGKWAEPKSRTALWPDDVCECCGDPLKAGGPFCADCKEYMGDFK